MSHDAVAEGYLLVKKIAEQEVRRKGSFIFT